MMTSMLTKNLNFIVPNMLTAGWVNFFFTGFVVGKVPFPLTQRFRDAPAGHRTPIARRYLHIVPVVVLPQLFRASRGCSTCAWAGEHAGRHTAAMQQQMAMGMNTEKAFASVKENLDMLDHEFVLYVAERRGRAAAREAGVGGGGRGGESLRERRVLSFIGSAHQIRVGLHQPSLRRDVIPAWPPPVLLPRRLRLAYVHGPRLLRRCLPLLQHDRDVRTRSVHLPGAAPAVDAHPRQKRPFATASATKSLSRSRSWLFVAFAAALRMTFLTTSAYFFGDSAHCTRASDTEHPRITRRTSLNFFGDPLAWRRTARHPLAARVGEAGTEVRSRHTARSGCAHQRGRLRDIGDDGRPGVARGIPGILTRAGTLPPGIVARRAHARVASPREPPCRVKHAPRARHVTGVRD